MLNYDRHNLISGEVLSHFLLGDLIESEHWRNVGFYKSTMQRDGYVKFTGLFGNLAKIMEHESSYFQEKMRSKSFQMPGVNSPRMMRVLNGHELSVVSPILFSLYFHHEIRRFLQDVIGSPVYSVNHRSEFMVSNMLSNMGHTHGWHLDDPRLALVIFLSAPKANLGGDLEYIPHWRKVCADNDLNPDKDVESSIEMIGDELDVCRYSHQAGDAYLLDANCHLHRVTPLKGQNCQRWVINMAFDTSRDIKFGKSADLLYG